MDDEVIIVNTVQEDDYKYAMMNNGINPEAPAIVAALGLNMFAINRFRDAGYDKHRKRFWILTRSGSDNAFGARNDDLKSNSYYESSADEKYDSTYEIFLFRPPTKDFKHVPVPDLLQMVRTAKGRMQRGQLNEYEKRFVRDHFGKLPDMWE